MREVKDLASGVRDAVANVKKMTLEAKAALDAEIARSNVNTDKIKSLTKELKDANTEVEAALGETGSNFPQSEERKTDLNGVTLKGPSK